jgi:hypothetical protein
MIARLLNWLYAELDQAEGKKRLLVGKTRLERDRLRKAAAEGLVEEAFPGAYARHAYWDSLSPKQRVHHKARAAQILHPNWVFAEPTAALIHGLAVSNRYLGPLYVSADSSCHRRHDAQVCHIMIADKTCVTKDDLQLTTPERTVGDCLRLMDFCSGLAIADSALRRQSQTRAALAAKVGEVCARSAGIGRVRSLLSLADGRAESGGESIARATMLELGLMLPDLQRWYEDPLEPGEGYRVDYVWDVEGGLVLGELDGNEKYTNTQMTLGRSVTRIIEDEHRRQSHIETRKDVQRFVRFGFADVMHERSFLRLLLASGVPRNYGLDERVQAAGGILRCR